MPSSQLILSGITWQLPPSTTQVDIYAIGGGGGGGGGGLTTGAGSGGGGGGSAHVVYNGSPGDVLTITIGAGGNGGTNATSGTGTAGGDTFVENPALTTICRASGGAFGARNAAGGGGGSGVIGHDFNSGGHGGSSIGTDGGGGGSAADTSISANGNNGADGTNPGAPGGASPGGNAGAGADAGNGGSALLPGHNYGGGGGGGDRGSNSNTGSNGAQGVVLLVWTPTGPGSQVVVPRNPFVYRPRQTLLWMGPVAATTPNTTFPPPRPLIVLAGQAPEFPPPSVLVARGVVRTVPYPRPIITTAEALPDAGLAYLLRTSKATVAAVVPPPRTLIVPAEQRLEEEGRSLVLHAPQPLHLPVWPTRVITTFHNEEWPAVFPMTMRVPLVHVVTVFDHCLSAFNVTLTVPVGSSAKLTVPVASGVKLTVPVASGPKLCNG